MDSEVTIVRIYLHETEKGRGSSLQEEIMTLLHDEQKVKGATVFRGISGFGASGVVHSDNMLRLVVDLPVVIEFFDETAVAEAVIRKLDGLVAKGHVVWWRANCQMLGNGGSA